MQVDGWLDGSVGVSVSVSGWVAVNEERESDTGRRHRPRKYSHRAWRLRLLLNDSSNLSRKKVV